MTEIRNAWHHSDLKGRRCPGTNTVLIQRKKIKKNKYIHQTMPRQRRQPTRTSINGRSTYKNNTAPTFNINRWHHTRIFKSRCHRSRAPKIIIIIILQSTSAHIQRRSLILCYLKIQHAQGPKLISHGTVLKLREPKLFSHGTTS